MYSIIYFSPSGNVKHLAGKLAASLELPHDVLQPLEFTDPEKLEATAHLVLLYPVHGFNAPRTVKRFVGRIPAGRFKSVSLVSVGCAEHWVNAAASMDLRKKLEKKGYSILMDAVLAMPLTFVMNFPEELNRKLIPAAEQKIEALGRQIAAKEPSLRKVPFKSRIINTLGKGESPAARLFGLELHANGSCTSCGTCWTNCPQKNIRQKGNGKPGFGFRCIMCMRCLYSCPEKAISPRFSKFIPVKGGYSLSKYIRLLVLAILILIQAVADWDLFWRRRHHPELESLSETTTITVRMDEVRGKHFRLVLHAREKVDLGEVALIPSERIHFWEAKAGFADLWGNGGGAEHYDRQGLQKLSPRNTPQRNIHMIDKNRVVDLSDLLQEDGTLNWDVPPGSWKLLRIG